MTKAKERIGIFAGTFDPVHAGHIAFALQAAAEAELERVIFLPERHPRGKAGAEHFGHRSAMIKRAIKPYKNLFLLELPDRQFEVARTLPRLQKKFEPSELVFLIGSDVALKMTAEYWNQQDLSKFLGFVDLVIGLRSDNDKAQVQKTLAEAGASLSHVKFVNVRQKYISSSKIREAIKRNQLADGLLPSVSSYAKQQWLYVSPADQAR